MEKINKLKKIIKQNGIDGYLIPKNDEYFGEYVSDNKDNLRFLTNFSGSFGYALIMKDKNFLFVDGRYTLQAKIQCKKNFKILTIPHQRPFSVLKKKKLKIGFDPKIHTDLSLKNFFKDTKCKLIPIRHNLINKIRVKNNKYENKKFFILSDNIAGFSVKNKVRKLRNYLKQNSADVQFITASENVAWLLNLRGKDCNFSPLPHSHLILDQKNIFLFCDLRKISKNLKKNLNNVSFIDIKLLHNFLSRFRQKKILIDISTCSYLFKYTLKRENSLIEQIDPIYLLKSRKNAVEIRNSKIAHIYDGVALTKFIFWLKENYKKNQISELSAQDKLFRFRKKNKFFKNLSFPTISSVGSNGAIIHYKASPKTNKILNEGNLYLVDSGGQYEFGTTDVTRTLSLNNKNEKIKKIYTHVLKSHIAVASYKISSKTCGADIDLEARKPLKKINLDYPHGTGHGVGYFLNVHEGPQAISKGNKTKISAGMILSNEPGFYKNGNFGIRIENLIFVEKNKGKKIFRNLTMAPLERSLINKNFLTLKEKEWINNYHNKVYFTLRKFMNKKETESLKSYCSNI
tara:strand:- start:4478 stop:6193 length:1716 start_codon:yes stop_codon:yes gene_type:complete